MNKYVKKVIVAVVAASLCVGSFAYAGRTEVNAASRPSFEVSKRTKKSATLKIKKQKNVTGYQIYLSTSKNKKFTQVAATRTGKAVITKLKKNKVYYVKIRSFKTVGYRISFGKFSKVKKIDKYGKKVKPTQTPTELPTEAPTTIPTENPDVTASVQPSVEPEQTSVPVVTP